MPDPFNSRGHYHFLTDVQILSYQNNYPGGGGAGTHWQGTKINTGIESDTAERQLARLRQPTWSSNTFEGKVLGYNQPPPGAHQFTDSKGRTFWEMPEKKVGY